MKMKWIIIMNKINVIIMKNNDNEIMKIMKNNNNE